MPVIASSFYLNPRKPRKSDIPFGDNVFIVKCIWHGKTRGLQAEVSVGSSEYCDSWEGALQSMERRRMADKAYHDQRADEEAMKLWLAGFWVERVPIGNAVNRGSYWVLDSNRAIIDGTEPPPGTEASVTQWPPAGRKFCHFQVVGVVMDKHLIPGVIVAERRVEIPSGYDYTEYDIQTAVPSPEGPTWRRWIERARLVALSHDDIHRADLYQLAAEFIDPQRLDELVSTVNHVTVDPRPVRSVDLPDVVEKALLPDRNDTMKLLCLSRDIWISDEKALQTEELGFYRTKEEALAALPHFVAADRNRAWTLASTEPRPEGLVTRYRLHVCEVDYAEEGSCEPRQHEIRSVSRDRERRDRPFDYWWYFNRKGACLGMVNDSELPHIGTPKPQQSFLIGDIIASRLGRHAHEPAIILDTPREELDARLEMSDSTYFIDGDQMDERGIDPPLENPQDAAVELYEMPVSDFTKRRLARLLAMPEVDPIVERFQFHDSAKKS